MVWGHLSCPRPSRRGPAHTSGPHLFPDGQLQALRLDAGPQALEVLVEVPLVARCVGHKVLLRSQEQHGLLPHTEDDALLPGAQEGGHPESGRDSNPLPPPRPLSRPFPSSRALHPTVSLRPESCPGSKAQTKCHPLPTLPPLRASSPPPELCNVNPFCSNIINEHFFSPLVDYRFLTGRITSWSLQLLAQSPGSIKGLIASVEEMNALTHNAITHSLCIVQTEGDSGETPP